MYNRYIPQPDGSYRRRRIQEPHPPRPPEPPRPPVHEQRPEPECREQQFPIAPAEPRRTKNPPCRQPQPRQIRQENSRNVSSFLKNLLPKDFDTGDLLIVLLLLLMSGDCQEDQNNALLTLALYLFM